MGIVKIEWEIGKSKADKIIIYCFYSLVYYVVRYFKVFSKNYASLRTKSKIPDLATIRFTSFYWFLFKYVFIPLCIALVFTTKIPEWVYVVYWTITTLIIFSYIFYFVFRWLLDIGATIVCGLLSFITTTKYALGSIKRIVKNIFYILYRIFIG